MGRQIAFLIIAGLFSFAPPARVLSQQETSQEYSAQEYFERGVAYYKVGNYRAAMENFTETLFLDPRHQLARDYLRRAGELFVIQSRQKKEQERREMVRRAQEKIRERKKAIEENYGSGVRHYRRGELLMASERFSAVLEIDREHKKARKYLELIIRKMENAVNKGQFTSVEELYYAQGGLFYLRGDWSRALEEWEKALQNNPTNQELLEFVEAARKKKEEQERLERSEVCYQAGLLHYNEGRWKEAVLEFSESLKANPLHTRAREYLARAKEKLAAQQNEERERQRREMIEKHYFAGIDHYAEGNFSQALAEWKKVLQIDPNHAGAKEYVQKVKEKMSNASRKPQAEVVAKKREEERIEAHYKQGINYYLEGNFEQAIRQWEWVLAMDPTHKGARDYIVKAKERLRISDVGSVAYDKEVEEYVKELEKRGAIDKEKEELIATHYQDGLVAYAQGDLSQAMKQWQIVLRLDPEHRKARRAIIKLQAELERRKGKE